MMSILTGLLGGLVAGGGIVFVALNSVMKKRSSGILKEAEAQAGPEESAAPRDKQTVEALLQSIEDQDKREQRNLRDDQNTVRTTKEWW